MPTELLTATEIGREFLSRAGYFFIRLERAEFDATKRQWDLQFDVGINELKLKKVMIDESGKVVSVE